MEIIMQLKIIALIQPYARTIEKAITLGGLQAVYDRCLKKHQNIFDWLTFYGRPSLPTPDGLFLPTDLNLLWDITERVDLSQYSFVFDIGSGLNHALSMFAVRGLEGYGFELSRRLFNIQREIMPHVKHIFPDMKEVHVERKNIFKSPWPASNKPVITFYFANHSEKVVAKIGEKILRIYPSKSLFIYQGLYYDCIEGFNISQTVSLYTTYIADPQENTITFFEVP
jgi:hypothetical protein